MAEKTPLTLVVMAAGMGNRFGGLKQLTPVGPHGEVLLEYAVFDALRAGFSRVVFVIKKEIEVAFKAQIGSRIEKQCPVDYVFQELSCLPEGFSVPADRVKPWGTGHAVLCCREAVQGAFAVINADDYYGPRAYALLADFLRNTPQNEKAHLAMAAYRLENTMTENGSVSRGVCTVDENDRLLSITEHTRIEWREGEPQFTEDDGASWDTLRRDCPVSMNCWAFPAGVIEKFEDMFRQFLETSIHLPKAEFYLPSAVDGLMKSGEADVRVLFTDDRWYGMTYLPDRENVTEAMARLTAEGLYPDRLS